MMTQDRSMFRRLLGKVPLHADEYYVAVSLTVSSNGPFHCQSRTASKTKLKMQTFEQTHRPVNTHVAMI